MPQFPSLPNPAHLTDLLSLFPAHVPALMRYTNQVLRDEGVLSVAQRELIAAYVSGLNACAFCHASHRIYATLFGIPEALIDALVSDPDTAKLDPKMRPLLAYAAKLNTLPSRLIPADAQAVLDAGWPEKALFEVIEVTALFNMYNRLIEGAGVNFDYSNDTTQQTAISGAPVDHSRSYLNYGERITGQPIPD
jgi:uncharacterized peroxidase-related enzyme